MSDVYAHENFLRVVQLVLRRAHIHLGCPTVQATCQHMAVHASESLPVGGSLPRSSGSTTLHAGRTNRGAVMPTNQWKHQALRWPLQSRRGYANTPRKCGSSMLRASYKQLREAPSGRTNLRELFSSRRSQLLLGWVSRGGLGTGAMLRSRLADAMLPSAHTPVFLAPPS